VVSRDCRTVDWFGQKDPVYAYVNQKSCEESSLRKKKRQKKTAIPPTSSHDFRCRAEWPFRPCPWAQWVPWPCLPCRHPMSIGPGEIFTGKAWFLPWNMGSSCKCSIKSSHWSKNWKIFMGYMNMNMDMYTYIYIYIYCVCNIMGVVVATRLRFLVLPPWKELFVFTFCSIVCLDMKNNHHEHVLCRFRHVKWCVIYRKYIHRWWGINMYQPMWGFWGSPQVMIKWLRNGWPIRPDRICLVRWWIILNTPQTKPWLGISTLGP
jgi:hypothetical protein